MEYKIEEKRRKVGFSEKHSITVHVFDLPPGLLDQMKEFLEDCMEAANGPHCAE